MLTQGIKTEKMCEAPDDTQRCTDVLGQVFPSLFSHKCYAFLQFYYIYLSIVRDIYLETTLLFDLLRWTCLGEEGTGTLAFKYYTDKKPVF